MKEFMFLFRQASLDFSKLSPEEIEALTKKWQDWVGGIAAQGKLAQTGNRLSSEGKVLKAGGVITDGPFVEIKEWLSGYMVVKADTIDEAVTLAHGCPAIDVKGSVEVRPVFS